MTSASGPPFTLIVVVNPGGQNNTEGNSVFGVACVGLIDIRANTDVRSARRTETARPR